MHDKLHSSSEQMNDFSEIFHEAVQLGVLSKNALLLDYCRTYALGHAINLPSSLDKDYVDISNAKLQWLDMPVYSCDEDPFSTEILRRKILRTIDQIHSVEQGESYIVYVAVPARNEEECLPDLILSLKSQTTDTPIVLLVGDNNSTDETSPTVHAHGGNTLHAAKPGVGATRQAILERILADMTNPEQTIIIQTDADCQLDSDYVHSAEEAFRMDPRVQVGVGPSTYKIPTSSHGTIEIDSGRGYGELLGTSGLRGYFEKLHRAPSDYLIEPPYRYLVGPNTTFRASLFLDSDIRYPTDGRWETLDLSIKIQQRTPSATSIAYIDGQSMQVSARAILGGNPFLTNERLQQLRAQGFVNMFKHEGVTNTPFDTMKAIIREIDTELYQLDSHQIVVGVVNDDDHQGNRELLGIPALHPSTRERLIGRVALIAHRGKELPGNQMDDSF